MPNFQEKRVTCNNCGELLVVHMRPPGSTGFFPVSNQEITCVECGVAFCVGDGFPLPIIGVYKELSPKNRPKRRSDGVDA